ncbi:unnamed protein product [Acidithrix sp. C25]|nr:unnamed protein product [Acidithrix sp. C25]
MTPEPNDPEEASVVDGVAPYAEYALVDGEDEATDEPVALLEEDPQEAATKATLERAPMENRRRLFIAHLQLRDSSHRFV